MNLAGHSHPIDYFEFCAALLQKELLCFIADCLKQPVHLGEAFVKLRV